MEPLFDVRVKLSRRVCGRKQSVVTIDGKLFKESSQQMSVETVNGKHTSLLVIVFDHSQGRW